MLICQMFQVGPERGAVEDQRGAERGEDQRRDAEEPDVERPDPEVEQIAADERAAAHAVFLFEAEHRHGRRSPDDSLLW